LPPPPGSRLSFGAVMQYVSYPDAGMAWLFVARNPPYHVRKYPTLRARPWVNSCWNETDACQL
jgi:hypothetical protein